MATQKVTFRIQRFDPEKDKKPKIQSYEVELEPGATLLHTLNRIRAEQDPTLVYRYSCGSAICGSCALRVNGHATLICKKQVSECVKDGTITLEPIGNAGVVRDLAADMEPFFDALARVKPYLQNGGEVALDKERTQSPGDFAKIDGATTCILCGACFSDCNVRAVDPTFVGPAALAKAHRFIFDSRDGAGPARLRGISEPSGVWDCTHCGECSTRCPTDTDPLKRIEEIRGKAIAEGHTRNAGARHALGFRETVGRTGRLDENYLPVRSVGFNLRGLFSIMPVGLRMFLRRQNPPLRSHKIEKLDEVKKVFSRFEELRK